jgi:hypothetical protein
MAHCEKFHYQLLQPVFDTFFKPVINVHEYNTRFSLNQTFFTPKVRTMEILILGFRAPKYGIQLLKVL